MAGLFDTIRRGSLNTETFELLTLQKVNQEVIESENLTEVTEDEDKDVNENYVDDPNEDAVEVLGDITNEPSDDENDDDFPGCVYGRLLMRIERGLILMMMKTIPGNDHM